MDADRFDDVLRQWGSSRRPVLGAGLGALVSLAGITLTEARKKKKKKKCKAPRVKCSKACCAEGEICQNGACTSPCPSGQTRCNGTCVDILTDGANCGGCGRVCEHVNACQQGRCPLACPAGQARCTEGQCVDITGDAANCGACGVTCPAGFGCQGGTCSRTVGTCSAGQNSCTATGQVSCTVSGGMTDCACVKDLSGTTICARIAIDNQLCGCQTDAECQAREFPEEVGGGTHPNAFCVQTGSTGPCNFLCQNTNMCAIPCQ